MKYFYLSVVIVYVTAGLYCVTSVPADCPQLSAIIPQCNCESSLDQPTDIVINCRRRGLTTFPTINGSYAGLIYEFTLAFNDIETVPDDAFQGLRIKRLDLTGNKLSSISDVAFRNLEADLTVLKLSGGVNGMSAPSTALASLVNLQELTLENFILPNGDLENSNFFQPFSVLQKLTLKKWNLKSIATPAFTGLTSLKELSIQQQPNLTSLPVGAINLMADTIEKIEISGTNIATLYAYSFQNMKVLKTLVLTSIHLAQLEEDCFIGLEDKLQFLDMSLNTIPISDLSKLHVLRALQTLKLQNSGLTTLPTSAALFRNKPNLQILDLRGNHFTDIPNGVFTNLSSLVELDLSENQIRTMGDTSLSGLTSLKKLDLGRQSLVGSSLTLPPLSLLTSLTTLNLVNTLLSTQSWNRISQAKSLTTLNLRQTGLTSIPNMSFSIMTNLSSLDLGNNQITTINQETFVGPKSHLTSIDLSSNLINYFDSCTFHDYGTQLKLNLIGNPLHCDCHLYWLSKAVRDGQISLETYLPNTCTYPSIRNGSDFSTLNPSDLCSTAPTPPVCSDYYSPTTTSTSTTTITTKPSISVSVSFVSATLNSISISWTLDQPELLNHITISHIVVPGGTTHSYSREITPDNSQYSIAGLNANTAYEICVILNRKDGHPQQTCIRETTKSTVTSPSPTDDPTSNSSEIGLIIGSVIGGLVLVAILVAIIYLMFLRKKAPKEKHPVQPRTFTRSELPQMGYDSKRYRRKKKEDTTDGNQNQVTVSTVTDGKNGQPNLGRISAGSYQYLDEKQAISNKPNPVPPYVNDAAAKQFSSPYENDVDMRPLPKKPQDSSGYYNPAFRNSTYQDQQPHTYTEIHL